jgi:hypothetical protein
MAIRFPLWVALVLAACGTVPVVTPTSPAPVRVVTTVSAAPFLRALAGRAPAGPASIVIALSPSHADLLQAASGDEALLGLTLFLPDGAAVWATAVGSEPVAVIVNPANGTAELSLGQVQDIYAGRNTQWAAAAREDGDDSRLYFESAALRGLRPAASLNVAPSPEAMLKFVGETPNGIGYLPLHWVDERVKTVALDGTRPGEAGYPLTALVVAVAKAEPAGAAREWLVRVQDLGEQ